MKIKMTLWVKVKDDHLGEATYYAGGLWKGDKKLVELLKMYNPEWNVGYHPDHVYNHAEYLCREMIGLKIVESKQVEHERSDEIEF